MSAGTTLGGGDDMQGDQLFVDDWAAAYALDALSPADRARFEAEASPAARLEAAARPARRATPAVLAALALLAAGAAA